MKIVRFGAVWCPGCLIMRPIWNKIENDYNIETNNYDYDMDNDLAEKFKVGRVLPVAIFLDEDDNELERLVGEVKEKEIIETISKYRKMEL